MAFAYEQFGRQTTNITQGTTVYGTYGTGFGSNPSATELDAKITVKFGFVVSNLRGWVSATTLTSTLTITMRINTSNGNCALPYGAAATGEKQDITHTDTVVSGDLVDVQYVAAAGGTSASMTLMQATMTPSSGQGVIYITARPTGRAYATNSTLFPLYVCDGLDTGLTEANQQATWRTAGTIANFSGRDNANSRSGDVTAGIRLNGAAGNSVVAWSITGEVAYKQDLVHTDSVVSGDLVINYINNSGALGGTFTATLLAFEFTASSGTDIQSVGSATFALSAAATTYIPLAGLQTLNATEANAQSKMYRSTTFSLMRAYVQANTTTANSTMTFRINAASGNQVITYGSGVTAFKEEITHTDSVVSGDLVCYQWVGGATGTSITCSNSAINATYPAAGGSLVKTKKGLAVASIKTVKGLAIASVKTMKGLASV